jgi:putative transposase
VAVDHEEKAALLTRLEALRADGGLTADHVRLAADGLGVSERTVWRWLGGYGPGPRCARTPTRTAR